MHSVHTLKIELLNSNLPEQGQHIWITDVTKGPDEAVQKYAANSEAILNSTTATEIMVHVFL